MSDFWKDYKPEPTRPAPMTKDESLKPAQKRPQNCGTSYCSCIECVMEPAPVQEPVCDKDPQGCWSVRCQLGKKCKNTPPAQPAPVQEPVAMLFGSLPVYDTTPPAAQRQWVGLEREIAAAVLDHCYGHGGVSDDMIERTTEVIKAKLKELNT
jgi:hypothetical protein